MKKCFLFLISSLIVYSSAFAQKPRIGLYPGVALSRANYEPSAGWDRRIFAGFDGGIGVEFSLLPILKIQPEANFSIIGVELNSGSTEYTVKLRYLSLPVLAKINVLGFRVFAGPQLGVLLSARKDPSGEGTVSEDVKSNFRSTDVLFVAGLEHKFIGGLFIGARYVKGLNNVAADNAGFEMRNRYLSLRAGFYF